MPDGFPASPTELTVQGQSLQHLYTQYTGDTFLVNRRYQRKLVWAVDEKQKLIDSVVQNLPIPLVLLAEQSGPSAQGFEIIDGLQRLNAIFSFLENEYPLDGKYFDLESLADTKYLKDTGALSQQTPVLDRETCLAIATYQLPVSIYRSATEESIDEVFRRINSSGRKLSFQEIRQAGVTSQFADLVRRLSAAVRTDITLTDVLPLRDMPKISITSRDLPYGILDEDVFWVSNGILERDAVRESRDEELVLDLVLDMLIEPMAVSGIEYRNSAYGRDTNATTSEDVVASRLKTVGADELYDRFLGTLDVIKSIIEEAGTPWAAWVITQQNPRGIPRYFHAVFIAIAELLYVEGLEVNSVPGLTRELRRFWDRDLSIPRGGGNWGVNRKRPLFDSVKAHLRPHFSERNDSVSVQTRETATKFELELQMSLTEKSLFELKQGFTRLDGSRQIDEAAFAKVLRTASAMANAGPAAEGRIFFGVADKDADVGRIRDIYGVDSLEVGEFHVTGTMHELDALGSSVDDHLRWIVAKIRNAPLESEFAKSLIDGLVPFRYKGRLLWSIVVKAGSAPTTWEDKFYVRNGNSTDEAVGQAVVSLTRRFL